MIEIQETDKKILTYIQKTFPLSSHPYRDIGNVIGLPEESVFSRVTYLRDIPIIRQISGIFDSRMLGYTSVLVAFIIPDENIQAAANLINTHPGISHNYEREHRYNLWFTLTLPPGENRTWHLQQLIQLTGTKNYLLLPATRIFKIGVHFDLSNTPDLSRDLEKSSVPHTPHKSYTSDEIKFIQVFQSDFPSTLTPYQDIAGTLNCSESEVIQKAQSFLDAGILRRVAGVIHHRKAGIQANAMTVWQIPESELPLAGVKAAQFPFISHCYQRTSYPEFPYSLYTMIHGKSREECDTHIDGVKIALNNPNYEVLYSSREFKKKRVPYFSPQFDDWKKAQTEHN